MEFADTAEQAALRDALRSFLRRQATPAQVRAAMDSDAGFDAATWTRLSAELGLPGLAVAERFGGSGAGIAEVAVAVAELGRVLLPSPYLGTALAAVLLGECADGDGDGRGAAEQLLPALADGSAVAALAWHADVTLRSDGTVTGSATHVVDGAAADVVVLAAGPDLLLARTEDAAVTASETLDRTRRQATLRFDATPAVRIGASARAVALHQVLTAVECVAGAEHCLDVTVDYLGTRHQFGRAIGSFQALKHRCADLVVAVAAARSAVGAAVWTAAHPATPVAADPGASLATLAPLAALVASRTFVQVTAEMIQLHGGIGFTWEHEAHLYFKRAKATQLLLGGSTRLRTEIGEAAGLLPAGAGQSSA